jgi:DNA/RNA endonuclease G (NUC1)
MSPLAVVYDVQLSDFAGSEKISTRHFKKDTKLTRPWVSDDDFKNSGYVRGHMCAAGFRDSNKALMKDTYYCSNICPMTMVCNSGPWKRQEDFIRLKCSGGCKLRVVAIANFRESDLTKIGKHGVRVPSYFVRLVKCLVHPEEWWTMLAMNTPTADSSHEIIRDGIQSQFILDERVITISYHILQWPHEDVSQTLVPKEVAECYSFPWEDFTEGHSCCKKFLQHVSQFLN